MTISVRRELTVEIWGAPRRRRRFSLHQTSIGDGVAVDNLGFERKKKRNVKT